MNPFVKVQFAGPRTRQYPTFIQLLQLYIVYKSVYTTECDYEIILKFRGRLRLHGQMAEGQIRRKRIVDRECPNPLFLRWLEEWRDDAKDKGLNSFHSFNKVG